MAFLQSEPPREPFLHAPASVLWLIGALVLAHVVRTALPSAMSDGVLMQYALIPARYAHPGEAGGIFALAAPLIGHMFLHGSYIHLAANCAWLLPFAPMVARRYGTGLFLLFFAICGVAGAITYVAMNWGSPIPVIGASGAVSGLMAAGIRMYPWPGISIARPLAPLLSPPVLLFSGIWLGSNVVFGLLGFGTGGQTEQIAWQAHLGGYFAGLLLVGVFDDLRRRRLPRAG